MDLHLPIDFERLPEFRMLTQELADQKVASASEKYVDCVACFAFMRLWVELAYMAQSTNQPGVLSRNGTGLLQQSLDPLFGDNCDPIEILKRSGIITDGPEGTLFCDRFARLNSHLAGNFKSKEVRGAVASALERNRNHIAHQADAQAMLLPFELFKRRDGTPLAGMEVNRCMVVIKTIDNCLKMNGRTKAQYSEGMIADAAAVAEGYSAEDLRSFYVFISLNRESPRVPKSTEQVLADFKNLFELSKS